MNILVINGSPKGENSITLQTVNYIAKHNPSDTFTHLHVGRTIKALERDFDDAAEKLKTADILLFSFPVYTFIAPCQLHRFFELIKLHHISLRGKTASTVTTSKHFYDITAHRYIEDMCHELGLNYIRGLSADMEDLLNEKGRAQALGYWQHLKWCFGAGIYEPYYEVKTDYRKTEATACEGVSEKTGDVVVVADLRDDDEALSAMIERFSARLSHNVRVVNIRQFPFRGGCLGCFNCAVDGTCIYRDGFDTFLRENIQTAEAMVYAFTISDHSMGARFKMFDDRQFCNGHRTVTKGTPVGYLISGDLGAEENLRTIIQARAEVGGNYLAGVAYDGADVDKSIDALCDNLHYAIQNKFIQPKNFYGVGGMKIFRDLIFEMRGMMKADHKFYKSQGEYDFPQKKRGNIAKMYLVGALLSNKTVRSKMGNKMTEGMLAPYAKVLK